MSTTIDVRPACPRTGFWNRGFAAIYPPVIKLVELAGVGAARREVVGQATGCALEVGAGMVTRCPTTRARAGADPDRARRVDAAAPGAPGRRVGPARGGGAAAEQLPVADASIDSVVCNLVLYRAGSGGRAARDRAGARQQAAAVRRASANTAGWARWQDERGPRGARSRAAASSRARHSRRSRTARWRSWTSSGTAPQRAAGALDHLGPSGPPGPPVA